MQFSIWIIAISVVVGPVLLGLLLHRLGFSRAVASGTAIALLGGAFLVSNEPRMEAVTPDGPAAPAAAPAPVSHAGGNEASARTEADANEIAALRSRIATLEQETAAHADARQALEAATARIRSLEAAQQSGVDSQIQATSDARLPSDRLKAAELRLAIANAEIERLRTALRATQPVPTATPPLATPLPFAHAPSPPPAGPAGASARADGSLAIATGATDPSGQPETPEGAFGRALANAMRSPRMALVTLADREIVHGQRGSYYRITCPGRDGRPLSFKAGDYDIDGGDAPLETCLTAVRSLLLDALPPDVVRQLYVQAYASRRGFIRPKSLPARDTHLRSFAYLPRVKGGDRFAAATARQSIDRRFTNAELANIRGAHVAHHIARSTGGAIRPEVLEGEFKPAGDVASQSFALLLYVKW